MTTAIENLIGKHPTDYDQNYERHRPPSLYGDNSRGASAAKGPTADLAGAEPGTAAAKHLVLKPADEEARRKAPNMQGFCVDELCTCDKHQCVPSRRVLPFEGYTTYRAEYVNKHDPGAAKQRNMLLYGPDGVPHGVDPKAWKEYVDKHGLPTSGQIPAHLFYKHVKDNRDFATENRAEYTPKTAVKGDASAAYGPDGVPVGVDPKAWKEYIEKHGVPPHGQIPAHLYYKPVKDNRDFATENRTEYTPKSIGLRAGLNTGLLGPDGVPHGVDPAAWKEYVAKYGMPTDGNIPAHLYYRSTPENRDFATNYRTAYVPFTVSVCPVTKLPPYPTPSWPREHTFWDPVAKKWY